MKNNTQVNEKFKVNILLGLKDFFSNGTSEKNGEEQAIAEKIKYLDNNTNYGRIKNLERNCSEHKVEKDIKRSSKKQEVSPIKIRSQQEVKSKNIIESKGREDR